MHAGHTHPTLLHSTHSKGTPVQLFRPHPRPLPQLPGLHCSPGLATHPHSSTGRDCHPATTARVIFTACNSDHVIPRHKNLSALLCSQDKKAKVLSLALQTLKAGLGSHLPKFLPQPHVPTLWFQLSWLSVLPVMLHSLFP